MRAAELPVHMPDNDAPFILAFVPASGGCQAPFVLTFGTALRAAKGLCFDPHVLVAGPRAVTEFARLQKLSSMGNVCVVWVYTR